MELLGTCTEVRNSEIQSREVVVLGRQYDVTGSPAKWWTATLATASLFVAILVGGFVALSWVVSMLAQVVPTGVLDTVIGVAEVFVSVVSIVLVVLVLLGVLKFALTGSGKPFIKLEYSADVEQDESSE